MATRTLVTLIGLFVALVLASSTLFVVKETERAIMLQFGEVVQFDIQPGLHVKVPFVNTVRIFDARVLTLDARPQRYLTLEKKALIVDSFVKWRIDDVAVYYTSTSGDEFTAAKLLASRVDTGLRNQFGERTLTEVVSGERDELMAELLEELNQLVKTEFGIEVVDVRVKRIDLPQEVSESVYGRMRTERESEAREIRSKGKEFAEGKRADADRQETVIEANAYRDAELVRGDGDAKAAAIYAKAFNKDPEFYSFYRSLDAYRKTFGAGGDVMLLEPDSEFFKYMNQSTLK
ncbi:MAG: protease modulator HflC [Gammaproteobacteria bacterium]|jgi:membrane protease subunit HflC|uniref:protease modulator HflC n=1 Tax=Candidatus Njordibacter sp. Uisw_058 TaxID=3230974 RepID=UPI00239A0368|nr:protease modulator HflC [Pseudomonadales bacterium]CAI8299985.1 MAG: Modulator of FtsH protease HflC [Oceanospirillaceae bacterium UBA2001]|tara:strand:+ start:24131 stop:25003 length:873 start_codon:yes stop_codon:yes gene_type:complete